MPATNVPALQCRPDFVVLETDDSNPDTAHLLTPNSDSVGYKDVSVRFAVHDHGVRVWLRAKTAVRFLRLRWNFTVPSGTRFLGDAWERSYGDLEWRGLSAARPMPWYFLAHGQGTTTGFGVKVRPGALCFWQADEVGVTLWLDVRSGGAGVQLGGRQLLVCEVVSEEYFGISAFEAAKRFCAVMCTDPLLPQQPIY